MKKFLLGTTLMLMTSLTAQAQAVSQADIEKYLQDHPEAIQNYVNSQKTQPEAPKKFFLEDAPSASFSIVDEITHNPQFYSLGNPDGTFVIIEFFDYQCGWCKKSNAALDKMLTSPQAKNIRLIPVPTPIFGENSETIAKYVLAAGKQDKFSEMHHAVSGDSGYKGETELLEIARSIGLDTERLQKDAHGSDIAQALNTANRYKSQMSISGVPTFIVNGKINAGAILDAKANEILAVQGTMPIFAGIPNASADIPTDTSIPSQPAEVVAQKPSLAPQILATLAMARQKGIIQQDGRFEIKEKELELAGQLFCSDSELESFLNGFEAGANSTNPDIEKQRQALDQFLRCASLSKLNFQDNGYTITLTGGFKFPFFEDKSVISVKSPDKIMDVRFGLNGTEQDVTIDVRTNKGEKLSYISFQYDADKLAVPFELGVLFGLMDHIKGSSDFEMEITRQMQIWVQENNLLMEKAARVKKAEIYQPDGKKVLMLNGEDETRTILRLFSSVEREFLNAFWTDAVIKFDLRLPQSANKLLDSEIKLPPNFQENYKKFMQKVSQNPNERPDAEIAQMLSGIKLEATLYGLDGQPLARLKTKLNDQITTPDRPENVFDFAALTILKASAGCSVRSMSFAKANPNVLTVCDSNGCSDQPIFPAATQLFPCLEQEATAVFTKFGKELEDELKTLSKVYIPGFSDGYNMAMSRYRANETLNAAAMVAIMGMSKNGGMGGDADLSDLGGVQSMKLDEFIPSDQSIRSDKNGLVTLEVKPEFARELMPIIGELSGKRVTSGCTADTTTCVIDMGRSVK